MTDLYLDLLSYILLAKFAEYEKKLS